MKHRYLYVLLIGLFTSCAGINVQVGLPFPERKPVPVAKKESPGKSYKKKKHGKKKHGKKKYHIPPGHYPPPGKCKVWIPGSPPGHQPKPTSCSNAVNSAPAGSLVLYRPSGAKSIEVKEIHHSKPGVVIHVEIMMIA